MKQCEVLKVNRPAIQYRPKPASEADLAPARRIADPHLDRPFLGSPRIRDRSGKG